MSHHRTYANAAGAVLRKSYQVGQRIRQAFELHGMGAARGERDGWMRFAYPPIDIACRIQPVRLT